MRQTFALTRLSLSDQFIHLREMSCIIVLLIVKPFLSIRSEYIVDAY